MTRPQTGRIGPSDAPIPKTAAHVAPRSPIRALAGLGVEPAEERTQGHPGAHGADGPLTALQGGSEDPEEAALRELAWGLRFAADGVEKLLQARQIRLAASRASSVMDPVDTRTDAPCGTTQPEPRSSEHESDRLLTPADLAELLQVSERTVQRWRHDGLVPPGLEIGGTLRWERDAVLHWIRERAGGENG